MKKVNINGMRVVFIFYFYLFLYFGRVGIQVGRKPHQWKEIAAFHKAGGSETAN